MHCTQNLSCETSRFEILLTKLQRIAIKKRNKTSRFMYINIQSSQNNAYMVVCKCFVDYFTSQLSDRCDLGKDPKAAMCVGSSSARRVLQFAPIIVASYVLHRLVIRVIHRLKMYLCHRGTFNKYPKSALRGLKQLYAVYKNHSCLYLGRRRSIKLPSLNLAVSIS